MEKDTKRNKGTGELQKVFTGRARIRLLQTALAEISPVFFWQADETQGSEFDAEKLFGKFFFEDC